MSEQTAEQIVKAVWPDARCHYYPKAGRFKIRAGRFKSLILGSGISVSEAWEDAAKRIKEGQ